MRVRAAPGTAGGTSFLKPRFGQKRDASRFVIRQSVVIAG